jgi:ATP-dependent Clp protease ATP-binding subunit ClpC
MKKVLPKVKRIINMSVKQAKYYGDSEVRIEHIIISLINDYNNNAIKTLVKMNVDVDKLHKNIEKRLIREKDDYENVKVSNKDIPIEISTENILKNAENECNQLNDEYLDTQHILLSSLKTKNNISNVLKSMKVTYNDYKTNIINSIEPFDNESDDNSFRKPKPKSGNKSNETPILDNFSIDVTKRASEGKIDPVIGRDDSIQRVAQILARKKKNNPIIIGDPGCVLGDTKIKVKKISDISIHNFIEK